MNEFYFHDILNQWKKYSIFFVVIIGSIAILSILLIMNQILEGSHLLHVAVHEIGFVLAEFLSIMVGIAYTKSKVSRNILYRNRKINLYS